MKQFITGYDLANTVRMAQRQRTVAFLLVEGETDLKVFRKFTLRDRVDILICHGRENALASVSELDRTHESGFLAVIDADFEHLAGRSPPSPNCLFTDHHDLEIDLLSSPALDRVLDERASVEKIRAFESRARMSILEALLERATPLGHLRRINSNAGHSLRFADLKHARFLSRDELEFDVPRLVDALVQRSDTSVSTTDLLSKLECVEPVADVKLLCCGHDVVAILAVGLRSALGSRPANEVSPSSLERELRLAFDPCSFE